MGVRIGSQQSSLLREKQLPFQVVLDRGNFSIPKWTKEIWCWIFQVNSEYPDFIQSFLYKIPNQLERWFKHLKVSQDLLLFWVGSWENQPTVILTNIGAEQKKTGLSRWKPPKFADVNRSRTYALRPTVFLSLLWAYGSNPLWNEMWYGVFFFPANQGIVGCTPTNVPLWEIPI